MAPLPSVTVAEVRPYLLTLFGAVIFVLLIGCVNVANLLLARDEARRKELAIRSAKGASGRRAVRQALTESLLFAVIGGAESVALAVGVQAVRAAVPPSVPRADEIGVSPSVMLFALAVILVTGLGSSVMDGPTRQLFHNSDGEASALT